MKNRATDTIHQTILRFVQCQGQKADLTAGSSENHILKGFFRIPEDRTTDSTLYFRAGTCLSSAPRTTPRPGCGQHQGQGRGRGSPQSPGLRSKGQNLVTQSQLPLQLVTDLKVGTASAGYWPQSWPASEDLPNSLSKCLPPSPCSCL